MARLTKSVVVDAVLTEELVPEIAKGEFVEAAALVEGTPASLVADPREQVIRDWVCQAVVNAPPLHQQHFAFYLLDQVDTVLAALDEVAV